MELAFQLAFLDRTAILGQVHRRFVVNLAVFNHAGECNQYVQVVIAFCFDVVLEFMIVPDGMQV